MRDPRAYLVRVVTHQALNRLRTVSRRREDYVGERLPDTLLTRPDIVEDVERAESVSIAMLTVLETLAPTERAVFVLREVFELPYGEIAACGPGPGSSSVRDDNRVAQRRARGSDRDRRPSGRVSRVVENERVTRIYAIANPRKLTRLDEPTELTR